MSFLGNTLYPFHTPITKERDIFEKLSVRQASIIVCLLYKGNVLYQGHEIF